MKRPVKSPPQPIHTPRYPKGLCLHTLVEFNHCDPERLKKVAFVRKSLIQSVKAGGGTIVKTLFHEFSPWGVSGVVVITESHVTVHTWPEHGYAAVDIFSCSPKLDHSVIRNQLALSFGARESRAKRLHRGPKSGQAPKTKAPRPSK
jgi:S-adenosylmethionine decarboxylase proenzyme